MHCFVPRYVWIGFVLFAGIGGTTGCGLLPHLTASLGGETAGQRGRVRVTVINNTPFQPVFTMGTFDELDLDTVPDVVQFGLTGDTLALEADATSDVVELTCARVLSIGGADLRSLVEEKLDANAFDAEALVEGVRFFQVDETGDGGAEPVEQGSASAVVLRIGIDYACEDLLAVRLEINDPGPEPFRVEVDRLPIAPAKRLSNGP